MAAFVILSATAARGRELRIFGALWFLVAFIPISNLLPLNAEVAEHWIYLASIGYLLFLAGVVTAFPPNVQKLCVALGILAVAIFGLRTSVRAADWADRERFFLSAFESGSPSPRIYTNLAAVYGGRGEFKKQELILRRALTAFPSFLPARLDLGACLVRQGRSAEAKTYFQFAPGKANAAAQTFPRTWQAALNLASVRRDEGKLDDATVLLEATRQKFPDTWPVVKAQADLLEKTAGPAAALPNVQDFVNRFWWHRDARLLLAQLNLASDKTADALDAWKQAAKLDIWDARPLAEIARVQLAYGNLDAALNAQREAVRRAPSEPSRQLILAEILSRLGKNEEASEAREMAKRLVSERHFTESN